MSKKGEGRKKKRASSSASPYREAAAPAPAVPEAGDDTEVRVGSILSWTLPVVTIAGSIAMGLLASIGPALLVLLGGAILGAVMLLWGSVRTLTGDAALTPALATAAIRERVSDAQERKRRALRALKDLEQEHDVGKIDDEDFERLSQEYRVEAKAALREIDAEIEPRREKAEELIREHLEKRPDLEVTSTVPTRRAPTTTTPPAAEHLTCPDCGVENDLDAAFCKGCGAKLGEEESEDEDEGEDDDDDEEPEE